MKTVYYAHGLYLYDTAQEKRDVKNLMDMGFKVLNPNDPKHQIAYMEHGFNYFLALVESCDGVAFRSYPDGKIGSGVYSEAHHGIREGKFILELPSSFVERELDINLTRKRLEEYGQR